MLNEIDQYLQINDSHVNLKEQTLLLKLKYSRVIKFIYNIALRGNLKPDMNNNSINKANDSQSST